MHDDIAANHPGMVNRLDAGFARRNDAGLALALRRAARVRDEAGYAFALDGYAAGFDDGHLATYLTDAAPALPTRWPGFLTGFDDAGAQVVKTRLNDAPVPLGARLVSCDGRAADALAAATVGAFEGRWFLASRRAFQGGRLFLDQGNPFVARPARCVFAGSAGAVTLDWRPIAADELRRRLSDTNGRAREPIGARVLADGTRWVGLSGFDGDPGGADAKALVQLIAAMRADRAALAGAPRIVLDLRGNNGGSSDWSQQVAEVLWSPAVVAAVPDPSYVEWRASSAVLAQMRSYRAQFDASSTASQREKAWARAAVAGVADAIAHHRKLWREPPETPGPPGAAAPALGVPIYYVTDTGCASACLDAVDLWRALGAIGVGQETSADSFYLDVREATLPSGLSALVVPMKVYRDRPRGSNVPVAPDYRYAGDLRDTSALARWIATLPGHRP